MPKMKTHRGAAKRIKKTARGKFKRSRAFASHLMAKKTAKRKRKLRKSDLIDRVDRKKIEKLLP